jgi:transposase
VSQLPSARTLADSAIDDHIRQIFAVESQIETLRAEYAQRGDSLPSEGVRAVRQSKSKPVMEKFKEWVDKLLPGTPPNSALGKALAYTTRQWPKLALHLEHGDVPAHNNFAERQMKQYALGRKAWLFVHNKVGAQASANLFTLVMTCRANEVEPFAYLNYLFEQLPMATTLEALEALLPWNVKRLLEEQKKRQEAARRSAAV